MNVYVELCHSLGRTEEVDYATNFPPAYRPIMSFLPRPQPQFTSLFRLPVWLASLLHAAKRLRSDCARRKKVCRLLQRKLFFHGIGVKKGALCQPTYVYPEEVKMLVRTAFPKDVCDYPDPCHDQVVSITVEDLYKVEIM